MDKQAVAKWRLLGLADATKNIVEELAALNKRKAIAAGRGIKIPAAADSKAAVLENQLKALKSYANSSKSFRRKGLRFFAENPLVKTVINRKYGNIISRFRGVNGKPVPVYNDNGVFRPYMHHNKQLGVVKNAPTAHDPRRMEFVQVPPEAVTLGKDIRTAPSVDFSKTVPTGLPLTINSDINSAVAFHMLMNRYGTAAASVPPKVKMFSSFLGQKSLFESGKLMGTPKTLSSPAYSSITDTVYMPNVAGMHNLKKTTDNMLAGMKWNDLTGASAGLPPKGSMRYILEHESTGHGGLFRKSPDEVLRLARKSTYLINRALKGSGYMYYPRPSTMNSTLPEFMANYTASNPGSVLRDRTAAMFRNIKPSQGRYAGEALETNMAGMPADTVSRTVSGLQQLRDNYMSIWPGTSKGTPGFRNYLKSEKSLMDNPGVGVNH